MTFTAWPSGFRSVCGRRRTGRRRTGSRLFGEGDEEDARIRSVEDIFAVYRLDGAAGQLRQRLRQVLGYFPGKLPVKYVERVQDFGHAALSQQAQPALGQVPHSLLETRSV